MADGVVRDVGVFEVVGGCDEVAVSADLGGVKQAFFDGEHFGAFGGRPSQTAGMPVAAAPSGLAGHPQPDFAQPEMAAC